MATPGPWRRRSPWRRPRTSAPRWSPTTRPGPASTTTGTSAAAATPTARSTIRPGTPSSTRRPSGSMGCRSAGEIVELAAGTGWWSPLLASKGSLSCYDASAAPLDRARERLLAHGLRAHLHVRDAWAEPDRPVDAVFCGFWLSHVPSDRLPERSWASSGAGCGPGARSPSSTRDPTRAPGPSTSPPRTRPTRRSSGGAWPTAASSGSSRSTTSRPTWSATAPGRRLRRQPRWARRRASSCSDGPPPDGSGRTAGSPDRRPVYSARCQPSRTGRSPPSAPGSWPRR